jgi:hypothetical protein
MACLRLLTWHKPLGECVTTSELSTSEMGYIHPQFCQTDSPNRGWGRDAQAWTNIYSQHLLAGLLLSFAPNLRQRISLFFLPPAVVSDSQLP